MISLSLFLNIVLILWYKRHLIILYLGVLYAALYFQVYRRCSNLNPRISKTISRKIHFLIMTNHFLTRSWPFPVKNVSSNINLKSKEKFLIDFFAINSTILIFFAHATSYSFDFFCSCFGAFILLWSNKL
jgi:hypothetical protein